MEQAQNQLAMQQQAVVSNSLEAKAQSDQALAAERLNKVKLDAAISAERINRAEEDKMGALLNFVKALKEIETMDLDNVLNTIKTLKKVEAAEKEPAASGSKTTPE